jgi:hypothetical protein
VFELPLVIHCFCFFFIFSLLTAKVYNCPLCLLFFNFSPHSLNFLFCPYSFYTDNIINNTTNSDYNVNDSDNNNSLL